PNDWAPSWCAILGWLVQRRGLEHVQFGIHGRHPPLKHHSTWAGDSEPVAIPLRLRGVGGQGTVGRWSAMKSARSALRMSWQLTGPRLSRRSDHRRGLSYLDWIAVLRRARS